MFRSKWLHNLLGLTRSRKDRRRQAAWQRRGVRPMLEALEDRITPSTVVTESAADAATLQADLTGATAAGTQYVINLTGASSAYNLSSGQELTVSAAGSGSSVTIVGTGQSITGNGNRVFLVNANANVTLQNLTIAGGTVTGASVSVQGGGLDDDGGNVTLSKVAIQDNSVSATTGGHAEGGGLFVGNGGNLTIQGGSVLQSNRAAGDDASQGGGVFVSGASTVVIRDSILHNNVAQGADDTSAQGGGLYVSGGGWNVTLTGDTLSNNSAMGGPGGSGAPGASGSNGGAGGPGGTAEGGAAYFSSIGVSSSLTILNDLAAPTSDPSIMIGNSAQGGAGGNGGIGGGVSGTAPNTDGGAGGLGGSGYGGALYIRSDSSADLTAHLGNTAFYDNTASGGAGGVGGAAGTGGSGAAGTAGANQDAGLAEGGGLLLSTANITMVNSTVAKNSATTSSGSNGGTAEGGGIYNAAPTTFDNNTITQNTINGATTTGSGVFVFSGNPTLLNNLIQGNQSLGSSAFDLDTNGSNLSDASNNFIGTISSNAVSTTSNIVGSTQTQLGGVVGVTSGGKASGGPIYYPLLSGTDSLGAGSTSALGTIANLEGTTSANATDEIGNNRSTNSAIDLGSVQFAPSPSPSPSPSPAPPPALSPFEDFLAIAIDTEALLFQSNATVLSMLTQASEWFLGQPLPATSDLIATVEADAAALLAAFLADLP